MERLTKKMNGKYFVEKETITPCTLTDITFRTVAAGQAIDRLAHYENLAEQGRLIGLPCKVGTPIFEICEFGLKGYWIKNVYTGIFDYCHLKDFGKTVFLTKEEAEAKLKEM